MELLCGKTKILKSFLAMQISKTHMNLSPIRLVGLLLICLFIIQASNGRDMSKAIPYLDLEEASFIARHENLRNKQELEGIVDSLREGNPIRIKSVVSELKELHDEEMLLILLEHCGMYEKEMAAAALKDVGGTKSLPKMIELLNRENAYSSDSNRSNSELDSSVRNLQNSIIEGIERISGIPYGKPGDQSRESVLEFIEKLVDPTGARSPKRQFNETFADAHLQINNQNLDGTASSPALEGKKKSDSFVLIATGLAGLVLLLSLLYLYRKK